MDPSRLIRHSDYEWELPARGRMRVPGILFADETLVHGLDDKVCVQLANVAALPGIVRAAYAMPDAHWGYGFPIGGVAAFDPDEGVVSAGGVGFDISCGVRTLTTGLTVADVDAVKRALADTLFEAIPAGVGSTGALSLDTEGMDAMLDGGARWAVARGYGTPADLERTEEQGRMEGAGSFTGVGRGEAPAEGRNGHARVRQPLPRGAASRDHLRRRGGARIRGRCRRRRRQHPLRLARPRPPDRDGVPARDGVDGLGRGIELPDRELACAPLRSATGERYLGAMRAAINCALANRQILTHLTREAFHRHFPAATLDVLYDVSHNTCKEEEHVVDGARRRLFVHRKGATRAFGPGHAELPPALRDAGQPVLIGGSMGTASHILAGTREGMDLAFGSACHGAGRSMSRTEATRRWQGRGIVDELAGRGVLIRSPSLRGVAEEAPGAYKDVDAVVDAAERAGLARKVARLEPLVCIKG